MIFFSFRAVIIAKSNLMYNLNIDINMNIDSNLSFNYNCRLHRKI